MRVLVHGVDVEALAQQVDEIASAATAGVEHAHARADPAAQQLVEQVDVDVAELRLEIHIRNAGFCYEMKDGIPEMQGSTTTSVFTELAR